MAEVNVPAAKLNGMTVETAFQRITRAIGPMKGIKIETPTHGTLTITRRYTPGWAVVLGIIGLLVFLLGLLFFLVKTTETIVVVGRDEEGGAVLSAHGKSTPMVVHGLLAFLQGEIG